MCLNLDEEFKRAFANVGLLGSDVWDNEKDVNYQKANLNLWIRCHEVEHRLEENFNNSQSTTEEIIRTVQDTIPFSRLASYNDFTYNEEREIMYVTDYEPAEYIGNTFNSKQTDLEVWMLPEVEEEFKRLTNVSSSKWCSASPRLPTRGRELASIEQVTNISPYYWLTQTSWPGKLLSRYPDLPRTIQTSKNLSLFKEDLSPITYDEAELEEKLEEFPCPRFVIESRDDTDLLTRIDCKTVRNCWDSADIHYDDFSTCFCLNADVPEFQPVSVSQQHYPSIYDTTYEAELFPYTNGSGGYQLQPQEISPPVYPEDQQVQNIPVFLRPPESYFNFEVVKPAWKKHQGAVLSNLVPLTGSDQYNPTEMPKQPQVLHKPVTTMAQQNHYIVSDGKVLNTQQMLALLDKWLKKIYNPRSSDFNSICSTSCKIDKIVVNVQQHFCCLNQGAAPVGQAHSQRPLYSDVLMNEASAVSYKYDELEREALEQYTGSDTTLHNSTHKGQAKQELEQESASSLRAGPRTSYGNQQDNTCSLKMTDFTPLHCSRSPSSVRSFSIPLPGSKRSSVEGIGQSICSPQKKALWMKKKKKKAEKKKKCAKHKKKPPQCVHPNKNAESEVILINKFIELNILFQKCFNGGHWKLVQFLLTEEVADIFINCLKMVKDCLDWFNILIVSKELKEDYRKNKRRLELAENVIDTLSELLHLFRQYICCFSKVKMRIECDNRLYFDPGEIIFQRSILCCEDEKPYYYISLSDKECLRSVSLFTDLFKSKYTSNLFDRHSLTFMRNCEWKLTFNHDTSMNKNYSRIRLNKEGNFYFDPDCTGTPIVGSSRKLIRIVDNFPVWHSWQWKFIEGWMFSEKDVHLFFNRLNHFNTKFIETVGSSARVSIIYNWVYEYIDSVVFQKNNSKYELLWNMSKPNLVSTKILFMKLLVLRENGWCFGDVRINKQACLPWMVGCEGPCCIQWLLSYNYSGRDSINSPKTKGHMKKTSVQKSSKHKKEEVKVKVRHLKSKSGIAETISTENQVIINKIASGEINLPRGKPLVCVLQ